MQTDEDLYSYLGVLPEAEPVVIAAAYRALASKYHPDRWTGDPAVAHERMAHANRAHEVLRDPQRRAQYDAARKKNRQSASFNRQEEEETAFEQAMATLEERWTVAVSVMPDLAQMRRELTRTSHQLAFAFVTTLLETRRFQEARAIAAGMEHHFLERFFGTNPTIVEYAKSLIQLGMRDAVRRLNQLVDVLGSDVDPHLLTEKVDQEFCVREKRRAAWEAAEAARLSEEQRRNKANRIKILTSSFMQNRYLQDGIDLASEMGYLVEEFGGGFISPSKYKVSKPGFMPEQVFASPGEFVRWAAKELPSA